MPFRYYGYTIRLVPYPVVPGRYIAEATSPAGIDLGPIGFGDSRLEAKACAMDFIRGVREIAAGTFEWRRQERFTNLRQAIEGKAKAR